MDLWNIPSRVATAGLVGLVVLDVVLVGAALRSTHPSGIDQEPASSASAKDAATALANPSVTATSALARQAAPLRTMLVAVDDQQAWRVVAGTCADGGATLTRTADGGKTWVEGKTLLSRIGGCSPRTVRSRSSSALSLAVRPC